MDASRLPGVEIAHGLADPDAWQGRMRIEQLACDRQPILRRFQRQIPHNHRHSWPLGNDHPFQHLLKLSPAHQRKLRELGLLFGRKL
ncbi:MAG: hypothetical protein EBX60_11450 [Betaproteobacteria bacterium]|nr:hypothetical protein [Betaproteobacteria bacterium]